MPRAAIRFWTFPRDEASGKEGAANLFAYLRKFGGLTSPHTSATGAGTDFRDIDPEVQPVVEIYQGYRSNYETTGRAARRQQRRSREVRRRVSSGTPGPRARSSACSRARTTSRPTSRTPISGWTASTARSILAAMKARRSMAATDNIFLDVRMGGHFMGESFQGAVAPLDVYVAGTGAIARVEVIKSNQASSTRRRAAAPRCGSPIPTRIRRPGESYYYVRVEQQNGQLGWSSPIWVENRR